MTTPSLSFYFSGFFFHLLLVGSPQLLIFSTALICPLYLLHFFSFVVSFCSVTLFSNFCSCQSLAHLFLSCYFLIFLSYKFHSQYCFSWVYKSNIQRFHSIFTISQFFFGFSLSSKLLSHAFTFCLIQQFLKEMCLHVLLLSVVLFILSHSSICGLYFSLYGKVHVCF